MNNTLSSPPQGNADNTTLVARIAELEQELASERARCAAHEQILATINDAVIVLDSTFRVQTWNAAAERMYGWSAAEAHGQSLTTLLQPRYLNNEDADTAFATLQQQGVWTGLVAQHHRDGHEIIIESAVRYQQDDSGTIVGLVGINRDVSVRQQSVDALRASEERFRQAIDHFPYAFAIYDAERRFRFVNTVAAQLHGRSEAELIGRRDEEIVNDTITSAYLPLLKRAIATRTTQRGECSLPLPDNTLHLELTYVPLLAANGEIQQILGITHDITPRVEVEARLTRSEANLRAFFDSAAEAHYLLDTQYRVLAFNRVTAQQVQAIWKRTIAEGDSIIDYVNPANRTSFHEHYQRALQGEIIRYERRLTYPSGQTAWYQLSYTPVYQQQGGTVVGVAFSGADITARKQTELALAQREAQFAGIIDSAMDAIITVNDQQQIVLFNGAAEQVFAITAAEVLGQTLDRFIPPEVRSAHHHHIPAFGRTGITRRSMYSPGVLSAMRADGTMFPIEASISQIELDGKPLYTVILRDITERTRLEAQLTQAQKMESIGSLAGGIAHDFNNLLTIIGGATELARETLPPDHMAQADLEDVSTATKRAATLTQQLLAFARRQLLAPRVLDLNLLVGDAEQLLRRVIGEDIHLITDLASDLPAVRADAHQLQQVLFNLAVNARDAMPHGGSLVISTEPVTAYALATPTAATELEQHARILVRDSGTGMTQEVVSRVFEPFFTTKAPGKGTGLGLATSYGIVRQHGGSIEVLSAPGKGTTFIIELPAVDAQPEALTDPNLVADLPHGNETILLVEDEDAVRTFASRVLVALGYQVLEASGAAEGLQIARTALQIDLLLSDIVMPEQSGPVLAAQLVAQLPNLPVLYMSGYAEHASLPNWLDSQAVVLQKPFTRRELARAVRAILDEPRAI